MQAADYTDTCSYMSILPQIEHRDRMIKHYDRYHCDFHIPLLCAVVLLLRCAGHYPDPGFIALVFQEGDALMIGRQTIQNTNFYVKPLIGVHVAFRGCIILRSRIYYVLEGVNRRRKR